MQWSYDVMYIRGIKSEIIYVLVGIEEWQVVSMKVIERAGPFLWVVYSVSGIELLLIECDIYF